MIELDLRAGQPIIYLVSPEEARAELMVVETAKKMNYDLTFWSCSDGFIEPNGDTDSDEESLDPLQALTKIREDVGKKHIYVFRDLHLFFANNPPPLIRLLRDIAREFKETKKTLILLSPVRKIPIEIEREVVVIDFQLPKEDLLKKILLGVYEGVKNRIALSDDDIELAVQAAKGLTSIEAEMAFAKALVRHARGKKNGDKMDPIPTMVMKEKAMTVKKAGILEYFEAEEDADSIGGLENLKKWLVVRAKAFSKKAKEFGLPNPRGILLAGLPGCIAEGTEITYKRGKRCSGRVLRIEALHAKFHGIRKYGTPWSPGLRTLMQSWDVETGKISFTEVKDVIATGNKPCIRITTEVGHIELTEDHPLLMSDGRFTEAGDLAIGDELLVRGSMLPQASGIPRIRRKRVSVDSLPIWYRSGSVKQVIENGKIYQYKRQRRARLVIEARMNGMDYEEYLSSLKSGPEQAEKLLVLDPEHEVHHIDEDPMNDDLENLMVMLSEEHQAHHGYGGQDRFNIEFTKKAKVTAIEFIGLRKTFDISIKEPGPHNFCTANGIIAHNCGKSLTAKAASNILNIPLIKLDVGRLFGGLVGASEENTRNALATIDAVDRCVVWIDEIEKAFAGMGGSGDNDSGVSKRIFGQIITWMQEKKSSCFICATCNNTETLPSELLRKGRFDEIFFVGLPDEEERRKILEISIKKYGRDPSKIEKDKMDDCVKHSKEFSGAELDEAVKSGLYTAFYRDTELDGDYIYSAITQTTPLAKSRAKQLDSMRRWASENAVNASKLDDSDKIAGLFGESLGGRQLAID